MPINQMTIDSFFDPKDDPILLEGQIAVEKDKLAGALAETKKSQIILSNLSSEDVGFCAQYLATNPNINTIVVKQLSVSACKTLIAQLSERTTPLKVILGEDLEDEPSDFLISNLNQRSDITLGVKKKEANWSFSQETEFKSLGDPSKKATLGKIVYSFKDKPVLSISFRDYQPPNVELFPAFKDVLLWPTPPFPNADLIKLMISKRKHPQFAELCNELVTNYFNGPLTDFLNHELGASLTISSGFLKEDEEELIQILEDEGIKVNKKNPFANMPKLWLRDHFLSLGNKYLMHYEWLSQRSKAIIKGILEIDPSSNALKTKNQLDEVFMGSAVEKDRVSMHEQLKKSRVNSELTKEIILDGGDIISILINGKKYFLIGENSKIINAVYRHENKLADQSLIQKFFDSKKPLKPFYQKLEEEKGKFHIQKPHIKEAKIAIQKRLGVNEDQIIWLPSPSFHLDMMITHTAKGVCINSFALIRDLMSQKDDPESQNIAKCADELNKAYGPILNAIKEKLIKKGIPVIDVPGVAYERDSNGELECVANFMNGYVGNGKKGHFFVTLSSKNKFLRDKFQEVMKQKGGIDNVYFAAKTRASKILKKYDGSLRCMSVQESVLNKLQRK